MLELKWASFLGLELFQESEFGLKLVMGNYKSWLESFELLKFSKLYSSLVPPIFLLSPVVLARKLTVVAKIGGIGYWA